MRRVNKNDKYVINNTKAGKSTKEIVVEKIGKWIDSNADLITMTGSAKIYLHIKDSDVQGDITLYPKI